MSILQVANLHFESTGNNRLQYAGSNTVNIIVGGATVLTANSTTAITTNNDILGKQTIWIPAAAMYTRTSNGAVTGTVETTTNKIILKTLDFDTAANEHAQFAIQMPKGWNEGTLIPQFIWSHASTTTNFGVSWGIHAVAFTDDDAIDAAFGANSVVSDTGGTTNDVYISNEGPEMTVAGTPGAEEYIVFELFRQIANTGDTMAIDARLHGVKIHYTIDAAKDN